MKKMMLMMAALLLSAISVSAQTPKVADKELVGAWLLQKMQWEGEKEMVCGKESGYTQFKYYGADGEYACAEISLTKEGKCVVMPHEYGTYTFKNGVYTEMGRSTKDGDMVLVDKNTFKGRWMNRHDIWKKQPQMPEKLVRYIVNCCMMKQTPAEMQQLIKENMFK
ncbi:MAG: hypothetical protein IJ841_10335 [Prevotella sp.]|nr:hypothetical protein [Prevotella sp.]